ncbi:MAG: NHLP bacteriocin export ABC transporter permease/ATPase subunit, partial [Betaproteobacteria bacterium]
QHHVLRARELQPVYCAVPLPAGVEQLVAVPGPGSSVELVSRADWLEMQAEVSVGELLEKLAEPVLEWSSELRQERHPDTVTRLVPGETATALEGKALACDHGTVVVEVRGGRLDFAGCPGATVGPGERIFLTRHAWLVALEPAELAVFAAHEAFAGAAQAFAAYEVLQRVCILAQCALHAEEEGAAALRLAQRFRGIESGIERGVLEMRRLLEPHAAAKEQTATRQDAIVVAARRVAAQLGIKLADVGAFQGSAAALVQALADASGVRVRSVTLAGEWWNADSGPVLAFRAEDEAPLVLVPGRGRRYVAHDPVSGVAERVGRRQAAGLKPYGFVFYRPFPHEEIDVRKLVRFALQGRRGDIGPVLVFASVIAALGLIVPIATAELVDRAIPSAQTSVLLQIGLVLLAGALVSSLFALARALFLLRVANNTEHDIQSAVWDRVLGLPIDWFRGYAVGDLTMRVNAINMVYRMLSVGTLIGLLNGLFSLLNFAVLFRFSPALALLALGLVAAAGGFLVLFSHLTHDRLEELVPSQRKVMALILQLVQGVAKLRTTASEARAFGIWATEFARFRNVRLVITRLQTEQKLFFTGFQHFGTLLLFMTMAVLMGGPGGSGLTTGQFVGFFAAFSALWVGVMGICETVVGLLLVPVMFKMAKPVLEALPETGAGKTDPGRISGAIEISQVSFAYPGGEPVLSDVSFSVPAGSFTAVVGPSGSGKSTLLRLLLGFDAPAGGAILFDDKNLQDLDQRRLRRQYGVVLQGSPLLAGDIFSNIVGVSGGTIEDAWEAARLAGLEGDIQAMPMGMHTAIGEGTSTLSGGQRQRILVARALVGRPRVVFLDEATSALDNQSQRTVADSLLRMKATRVVIAHRLSTIAEADQIIVMDSGRVLQCGTYAELVEQEGLFAELAHRQSLEEADVQKG